MHIISLNNNYDILYTEKYSPPLYFLPFRPHCQRANLRLDEQKYLTLSLLKPNLVWANSLAWAKLLATVERRKYYGAKITLYTFKEIKKSLHTKIKYRMILVVHLNNIV